MTHRHGTRRRLWLPGQKPISDSFLGSGLERNAEEFPSVRTNRGQKRSTIPFALLHIVPPRPPALSSPTGPQLMPKNYECELIPVTLLSSQNYNTKNCKKQGIISKTNRHGLLSDMLLFWLCKMHILQHGGYQQYYLVPNNYQLLSK